MTFDSVGRAAPYAAAAWAAAFGLVHLYWLLDGRWGLPSGKSVYDNTPLLVIDIVAIPLCTIAVGLALALVRPWGRRIGRRWLLAAVWGTAVLLTVHALPTVPTWLALASGDRVAALSPPERFSAFLYEPYFLLGGLLFAAAAFARSRA